MDEVEIHEMAIISPWAEIGEGVEIGPYTVVGDDVKIGSGTRIGAYAHLEGPAELGKNNYLGQGVSVGLPPQSVDHEEKECFLSIGDNNEIRDYVSIHRGPVAVNGGTRVGNNNFFQRYSHIAYNCLVGDNVCLDYSASIADNVFIGDKVYCGKLSGVHQQVRVGRLARIEEHTKVIKDVPPFIRVLGHPSRVKGLNKEGIRKIGLAEGDREKLRRLYKLIYAEEKNLSQAVVQAREELQIAGVVEEFLDFLQGSKRGVCT
ncbi:MAG: acyl-ACP--UDP-N-acetylglucosamine O-acyltransferase [Halanaerobiaceae bacterium]